MKVFISWSGNRSKAVANLINEWIKCVLQASDPWISTRDIDRGANWLFEINRQLAETSVGIVLLTQENKNKPWVLFEAGALAKGLGLSSGRVCTFLVDLEPHDVQDPLSQFNHSFPTKESMFELVRTLNRCLDDQRLGDDVLAKVFTTYWPQFESEFQNALDENPPTEDAEPRDEKDILAEILRNTRQLNQKVVRSNLAAQSHDQLYDALPSSVETGSYTTKTIADQVNLMLAEGKSHREILEYLRQKFPTLSQHRLLELMKSVEHNK